LVIDENTQAVVATIPVGEQPVGVAITPDGRLVYVANSGDGTISAIDTTSNVAIGSFVVNADSALMGLAIGPPSSSTGSAA